MTSSLNSPMSRSRTLAWWLERVSTTTSSSHAFAALSMASATLLPCSPNQATGLSLACSNLALKGLIFTSQELSGRMLRSPIDRDGYQLDWGSLNWPKNRNASQSNRIPAASPSHQGKPIATGKVPAIRETSPTKMAYGNCVRTCSI